MYWSTRFNARCKCVGIANYLVNLEFEDRDNNGWYHCQEIKTVPKSKKNVIDITDIIK